MLPPSKRLTCYLYEIVDDLGTIRYVGKGTGKRRFTHSRIVDGLITGRITRNAAYVHRQMAAAIQAGRTFSVRVIAEHLSAETAYGTSSGGFEKIFDHPPPNWAGRPNLP